MLALLSRWPLGKKGCPPELQDALKDLCDEVRRKEAGTLVFTVNFPAPPPPIGPPPDYGVFPEHARSIPMEDQKEIVFFEIYQDAAAFSAHLRGPFAEFLLKYRYLLNTPWQGHPVPITTYLDPHSSFVRQSMTELEPA